jgi:hypothetical protein
MGNIQEIIVFTIIVIAVLIAGFRVYRSITGKKSGCDGCSSDCSGCSLSDLKDNIEVAKKNNKN